MTSQGNSRTWEFSEPPNFLVAVARTVLAAEEPVYCIRHTNDGGWIFFGSPARIPAFRTRLVQASLGDVVARHPYLIEFARLPIGAQVERYPAESPWLRSILKR